MENEQKRLENRNAIDKFIYSIRDQEYTISKFEVFDSSIGVENMIAFDGDRILVYGHIDNDKSRKRYFVCHMNSGMVIIYEDKK